MSKKIDIVGLYLDDYSKRMTGREIARNANINHQTALNHLKGLIKTKVILYQLNGRNKEYSINFSNLRTRMLIETAEILKSQKLLANKELFFVISEMIDHTDTVLLFGSFASGRQVNESDIDLVIIGNSDKKMIKKIISRYKREINAQFISYADFKKSLHAKNALSIEILKNHAVYGNVSKIIDIFWKWYIR